MIQSLWQLLANYGIDTTQIAAWFQKVIAQLQSMGSGDAAQYVNAVVNILQQLAPTTTAVSSSIGA